jgi:HEAT repeat protein
VIGEQGSKEKIAAVLTRPDEPATDEEQKRLRGWARGSAAMALGIMQARTHEDAVAKLLNDDEGYVREAAAVALVLMDSQKHAGAALAATGESARRMLSYHYFSPVVEDQVLAIRRRYDDNLRAIRARLNQGAAKP